MSWGLVVESSAVAEQTGWLVLRPTHCACDCHDDPDFDGEPDCDYCDGSGLVSPLVPADCLPHPCPEYEGRGWHVWANQGGHVASQDPDYFPNQGPVCPTCGGSGTVAEPFHIGTEQWRAHIEGGPESPWHTYDEPVDRMLINSGWPYQRRQALLATAVITSQPIPVVEVVGLDDSGDFIEVAGSGRVRLWEGDDVDTYTVLPALVGLVSPGDVVVRVELTPLEEPIVEMELVDDDIYGDKVTWMAPLDFPVGVFTKEEQ